MIGFQEKRDPRRQMVRGVGAMYSLTRGMSMEEGLGREEDSQKHSEGEGEEEMTTEVQHAKSKEKRESPSIELVAVNMGLKLHAGESNRFPQKVTYEEIVEGLKKVKYKITYTEKRSEMEVLALLEKQRIKLSNDDFKVVPDNVFRKIRKGKEVTLPTKPKKQWQK